MSTASGNLLQLDRCATFYDHLPAIEAAMQKSRRVYAARTAAGWELDEGGWYAPHPDTSDLIHEWDWMNLGLDYPEDIDNG